MRNCLIVAALTAAVAMPAAAADFTVTGDFQIPGSGDRGPASTYPIVFDVTGLEGAITDVNLTLTGLSHSWSADLGVLLVGPSGANVLLMSDAGGSADLNAVTMCSKAGIGCSSQLYRSAIRQLPADRFQRRRWRG